MKFKIVKKIVLFSFSAIVILFLYIVIIYPEGSKVVSHYVFGNGKKYEHTSDYIPKSPIIIES